KLLCGSVGIARGRAREDSLELIDLAALDVRETGLDAPNRLGLLAVDQLRQLPLATTDPFVELVECTAPFGRIRLELGVPRFDRLLGCPGEIVTEPDEPRPLLLALRLEPLGVGGDSRLRLGDELLLALLELRQLLGDHPLGALEIVRPGVQPALDLLLRRHE